MTDILLRYIHFFGILLLGAALFAENLLLRPVLQQDEVRRLARIDALYGLAALLVLGAGLSLWLIGAKGAAFYSKNPVFHAKLGLFALMGLASLIPTVFFLKNRSLPQVNAPASVRLIVRMQLLALPLLPLLAVLMARGIGLEQ
ncbi:DUF2214 family protein [Massilia sp. W12]|uniref:DUF2214 family protein n=1 Tax=Massilia sp. W12 TaxID=3126507 RepID=UPI0030CF784F